MSASRDKTQKIAFVYSNLYSIYRKGVDRAREEAIQKSAREALHGSSQEMEELVRLAAVRGIETGKVIKAGTADARVQRYSPAELLGKRVARPAVLERALAAQAQGQPESQAQAPKEQKGPIEGLKDNLKALNELQARLRFMLEELEQLIKD
jgi:hypothetical protein